MKLNLKPTKKQLLAILGVIVVLGGAVAIGVLSQQLLHKPEAQKQPNISGLPDEIDSIQQLRLEGKSDEASKKVDDLLSQQSTDNETKFLLYIERGNALYDAKKYQASIDALGSAIAIHPRSDLYTMQGQAYYKLGKYAESADAFQKALDNLDKNDPLYETYKSDLQNRVKTTSEKVKQ